MGGWTIDEEKPVRGAGGGLTNKYPFKGTPVPINPSPPPSERRPKPRGVRGTSRTLTSLQVDHAPRVCNHRGALLCAANVDRPVERVAYFGHSRSKQATTHVHGGLASSGRLAHGERCECWTGHRPVFGPRFGYQPERGFFVSGCETKITQSGLFCAGNDGAGGHGLSGRQRRTFAGAECPKLREMVQPGLFEPDGGTT